MHTTSDEPHSQAYVAAFQQGTAESGLGGRSQLRIKNRWSRGDAARLRKNAAELVALEPRTRSGGGGTDAVDAAAGHTHHADRIAQVVDPVGSGAINSLAQPGGNATGFLQFEYDLAGKWLELLKEVAPRVRRVAGVADV